jgi:hypothetical protein
MQNNSATFKPKQRITAKELMLELERDPEFARRKAEQEKELERREAQSKKEQTALLQELAAVGVKVSNVWDLVNTLAPYSAAIPILLDHLKRPYSDGTREGIARSLAVRAARPIGWSVLVKEFEKTDPSNIRVKDGIAVALAGASDDTVISELIDLAKDRRHGDSRLLLLRGIRRSRRSETKRAIEELAADPALSKEIGSWKKRSSRSD